METIKELLRNEILIASVSSWLIAQFLKGIFSIITKQKFSWERFTGAGGMPSGHSATVCCLTISTARVSGLGSPAFAFAVLFAMIVMYDAMGVRHAAGQHAKIINKLVENVERETQTEVADDLKESLGHTPLEVTAGALLGIIVAMVFPLIYKNI